MDKQGFAQLGMFVLIGLNVGAYYVFWPKRDADAQVEAKAAAEPKGEVRLLPGKKDPAKAKELPAKPPADAPSPIISVQPKLPDKEMLTPDEVVAKLISRIKEQSIADKDKPVEPKFPNAGSPNPLPKLEGMPVLPLDGPNVGVTKPLTPAVPAPLWKIQAEPAMDGGQTNVTAELNGAKFTISCKQFEMKPGGADAIATGDVSFDGEALGGLARCKRLVISLGEPRVVCEEQVIFIPANGSGRMIADRLVWERPSTIVPIGNGKSGALGAPK
jgi:hypothetical protein